MQHGYYLYCARDSGLDRVKRATVVANLRHRDGDDIVR